MRTIIARVVVSLTVVIEDNDELDPKEAVGIALDGGWMGEEHCSLDPDDSDNWDKGRLCWGNLGITKIEIVGEKEE